MKKLQRPSQEPEFLSDLHTFLMAQPIIFRDRLCKQCSWSVPTFYRKKRLSQAPKDSSNATSMPVISNAEKEMILAVMDATIKQAIEYTKKYIKS
jgi:hypothetical protein